MLFGESATDLKYKYKPTQIVSGDAQLRAPISQKRYVIWGVATGLRYDAGNNRYEYTI